MSYESALISQQTPRDALMFTTPLSGEGMVINDFAVGDVPPKTCGRFSSTRHSIIRPVADAPRGEDHDLCNC